MRPALAYSPGRSPLHRANAAAAIAYLGALAVVGFVYSSPLVLVAAGAATAMAGVAAGAGRAVRASLALAVPLLLLMVPWPTTGLGPSGLTAPTFSFRYLDSPRFFSPWLF